MIAICPEAYRTIGSGEWRGIQNGRYRFDPYFASVAGDGVGAVFEDCQAVQVLMASTPEDACCDAEEEGEEGHGIEKDMEQALHGFALIEVVPHSGQRSGLARRSYPQTEHCPPASRRALRFFAIRSVQTVGTIAKSRAACQ